MIPQIILPERRFKMTDGKWLTALPYRIADEKALLSIQPNDVIGSISILSNLCSRCIKEDINIDSLHFGELMWIYLNVYAISVSTTINFVVGHKRKDKNGKEIDCSVPVSIKIDDIKFEEFQNELIIPVETTEGKYNILMQQPTIADYKTLSGNMSEDDLTLVYIKSMYDESGNNYIELTHDDKVELMNMLDAKRGQELVEFAKQMSRPYYDAKVKCPICGYEYSERIYDFFI